MRDPPAFRTSSGSAKRTKSTKRYVPQKNSVAYALLITLYRGTENGDEFMRKQELIDAAEASGLSRVPIMPEKGKGKPTTLGNSAKEWYSGWSCMKTLITKGLVLKLSCPAKYMLTEDGQEVSRECLLRSGLADPVEKVSNAKGLSFVDVNVSQQDLSHPESVIDMTLLSSNSSSEENLIDMPWECLDKNCPVPKSSSAGVKASSKALSMPPLSLGERFEDAYEVVFLLDDREQLAAQILRSRSIIESVISESKTKVEVRRLPVGDGIWIARHNYLETEYVLDFIVERKNVDDLRCSISDNRYRDQKLRLLRCGLKKLIYLVEGDPNSCEAAESIKTACFTTEILEGFDVQRTENLTETLRKYGYLTEAIFKYYKELPEEQRKHAGVCLTFDEFNKRSQDLDKMTVSDVFAVQLMQVPQVTEEVAIAVLDLYPTPFSLAHEYSLLEGDVRTQEMMLRTQSNNVVNAAASKNIFRFVWSN
ncbi:crossover junction endonuclease MUS81-like [Rosa sericea]